MNSNFSNQTTKCTIILVLYFYIWPTVCYRICFHVCFLRNCRRNTCDKILLAGATKARQDSVWQLNLLLPLRQGVWHMTSPFWSDVMQPNLVHAGLLDVIQISHSATSWKDLCDTEDALRPPRMQMHIPLQSFLSRLPMPYAKQTSSC